MGEACRRGGKARYRGIARLTHPLAKIKRGMVINTSVTH